MRERSRAPDGSPVSRADKGLLDRTLSGFLWSLLSAGGQALFNAVVVIVLARLLTPSEFGIVGAATVVISFAQIFTLLGVGPALVHLPEITRVHVRVGFGMSLALGLLFGVIIFFSSAAISRFFSMPELEGVVQVMAIIFPIAGTTSVGFALLQRDLQFRPLAMIELVSFVVGFGMVAITLALLGFGVWSLVAGQLGQATLRAAMILWLRREHIGIGWSRAEARDLLSYGTGHSLARVANYMATQGDNLVIGRFLGADALGLYTRAYQFMMLPTNLIGTVLNRVMFPAMAAVQDDRQRLGRAYLNSLGGVTLVTMPLAAVLFVAAPDLVLVVLGPNWLEAVEPFRILIVVLTFRTAYKISDSLAQATGAVYRRAWRQWVYAGAVLGGAFVGQAVAGLEGVAVGVALAVTLNYLLMLQLAITLTSAGWRHVLRITFRHAAVAVLIGVVAALVRSGSEQFGLHAIVTLLVTVVAPALIWLTLWLLWPSLLGSEGRQARRYAARTVALLRRRSQ